MKALATIMALVLLYLAGCGGEPPHRCKLPECAPWVRFDSPRKFIVGEDRATVRGTLNVGRNALAAAFFTLNGGAEQEIRSDTFSFEVRGLKEGFNTGVVTVRDKQGREATDQVEIFYSPGAKDLFFLTPEEQKVTWSTNNPTRVAEFSLWVWQMQGTSEYIQLALQDNPAFVERVSFPLPQTDGFVDRKIILNLKHDIKPGTYAMTVTGTVRGDVMLSRKASATLILEVVSPAGG